MSAARAAALLLVGALALAGRRSGAEAQDEPKPPAPAPAPAPAPVPDEAAARKEAKVRKFLHLIKWQQSVLAGIDASFEQQNRAGRLPKGFAKKFREVADFQALEEIAVEAWGQALDEPTLDALIAFHESEAGRRYADAAIRVPLAMNSKIIPWAMQTAGKTMQALLEDPGKEKNDMANNEEAPTGSIRDLRKGAAAVRLNETAAIATLRNLASCQAQIQTAGLIDCDRDGIGEYGTILEMTGSAGVRRGPEGPDKATTGAAGGSDFSHKGEKMQVPLLSPSMAGVDPDGVVRKGGYCFRVHLPDTAPSAGFVHETGPADRVGLAGGTGKIGIDLAETTWCAYAWPEKLGDTGTRVFFVNQAGDVLQSANGKSKWGGEKSPPADSAFRGAGITSEIATGTLGRDGEVWKVTN